MIRFDYDSVMGRLKERVLRKLGGKSLVLFSTNSAILEACAEEMDDLAMYDEFLTRESVWDTAHGASSIMRQASFFAYSPHRKIGARGTVRISTSEMLDGAHSSGVVIPAFTQVTGGGASAASLPSFLQRKHNLGRENIVLDIGGQLLGGKPPLCGRVRGAG